MARLLLLMVWLSARLVLARTGKDKNGMTSFTTWLGAAGLGIAAFLSATSNASAAACPAGVGVTTCTANGETFTLPGDPGIVGSSGNGLTLVADFTTSGQSNSGIAADVEAF